MFLDLVKKSRSCRKFDESYIFTKEALSELVEAARFAPSSINLQPLKYRLVFQKEETESVFPFTKWAGLIKNETLPPDGHRPTAYIVICHDTEIHPTPDIFLRDVGSAAQTMLLAAAEKDLGGCMIGCFDKEAFREKLQIPDRLIPMLVLALGKPEDKIVLTDAEDGNVVYTRENGIQFVPKRLIKDIIF